MTSPADPHSASWSHINGSTDELLDRLSVQEICKGWPVYRDGSEWKNFRSLFAREAWVWTTWSGPRNVDEFIAVSQAGKAAGVFISHRECGTLVELAPEHNRAIGKMRATISQRFRQPIPSADGTTSPDSPLFSYDVECDCRFIFFCERVPVASGTLGRQGTEWKTRFVKLIYEKDRVIPADGTAMPPALQFTSEEVDRYPEGYRYLGASQARLGYPVELRLPTPRDQQTWQWMYGAMEGWLKGEKVQLMWEGEGDVGEGVGIGKIGKPVSKKTNGSDEAKSANGLNGHANGSQSLVTSVA